MGMRTALAAAAIGLCVAGGARAQDANPMPDYVWGTACKTCHAAEYDAWEKTKHAHALARLSTAERQPGDCVGCHVTGSRTLVDKDANANVQCEACHGAGRAHIAAAESGAARPGGIVRKPAESTCTQCHNDKGPHFKFFAYSALAPLVHPVTQTGGGR